MKQEIYARMKSSELLDEWSISYGCDITGRAIIYSSCEENPGVHRISRQSRYKSSRCPTSFRRSSSS